MSADSAPAELRDADLTIPSYAFPEAAAIALGQATRYATWRARPIPVPPQLERVHRDEAAALVARALGRGGGWLQPDEVAELLTYYGLPLIEQRIAATVEEATAAAVALSGAVALKAMVPGLLHKTEAGLVRLNLTGAEEVGHAATEMTSALAAMGHPAPTFLVQRMAQPGVEMIVGLVHDPHFGPIVACGAGGVLVEILKDVAVRLTPLAREDATEMVRSLKTYPLLEGYRGAATCDIAALEDALLRVSALAEDIPSIAELDLNPILVSATGAVALDARIRVQDLLQH
jgi:acyl-CoA synthetase (NDP forming)